MSIREKSKEGIKFKTWKVFNVKNSIAIPVAYVTVLEKCTVYDTSYAALQLVRKKLNDNNICMTQFLDEQKEHIQEGIPVFMLE